MVLPCPDEATALPPATAGGTVPWLRRVSVLGARSTRLPVNRTARAGGVTAAGDGRRLAVGDRRFSLAGHDPADVVIESLERDGLHRTSTFPARHVRDR